MNTEENKIPVNGQISAENQNMADLSPEILEKVDGGILFSQGPTRCIICGKECSSPYEYVKHIADAHGGK